MADFGASLGTIVRRGGSLVVVSPIALLACMRRWHRHAAVLGLLAALVCAIAVHHATPAMGAPHHDDDLAAVAEMCLGVFAAVGAAVVAVAFGLVSLGRWRPAALLTPAGTSPVARPPVPRSRAGPELLTLLCVSRC